MLGSAKAIVYAPHPVAYRNENDWSIVLMVRCGDRAILMTGDIEDAAEADLVAYNEQLPLKADILKVPHHGSDTSSSVAFIQAVAPSYTIVSCASDASRDYPSTNVAMRLHENGVNDIFTTETMGDILVTINDANEMLFKVGSS